MTILITIMAVLYTIFAILSTFIGPQNGSPHAAWAFARIMDVLVILCLVYAALNL